MMRRAARLTAIGVAIILASTATPAIAADEPTRKGDLTHSSEALVTAAAVGSLGHLAAALPAAPFGSITSVSIRRSSSKVYPAKDGYLDDVTLTVTSVPATPGATTATGSVKILDPRGKTVASWKLTSSEKWTTTWNGKVGSRVVYGKYTVKASLKGQRGATVTSSTAVRVERGKLVTKTLKTRVASVLTSHRALGATKLRLCPGYDSVGEMMCVDDGRVREMSSYSEGSLRSPRKVAAAQQYGAVEVRVSADVPHVAGDVVWAYAPKGKGYLTKKAVAISAPEVSTPGWLTMPSGSRTLIVRLGLGESSWVEILGFEIEYRYKVLRTS